MLFAPVCDISKSLAAQEPVQVNIVSWAPAPVWVILISTSSESVAILISVTFSSPLLDEFSISAISISSPTTSTVIAALLTTFVVPTVYESKALLPVLLTKIWVSTKA